eukprot:12747439-Alexandrium_andersonii.AAC.1
MPAFHKYCSPEVQRAACEINGPCPTEAQGGRWSEKPPVLYKGVGWEQIGLILSEMRCRNFRSRRG